MLGRDSVQWATMQYIFWTLLAITTSLCWCSTNTTDVDELIQVEASGCSGWLLDYGGKSICYHFITSEMDWYSSETYCGLHYNGHLASPADAVENEFLRLRLIENYAQSLDALHRVWIGAYRFDGNDNWTYTTGTPVTYTDWYSGQPDESGDACVSLIGPFTSNYFFNWADYPCDEGYAFSFVCQEN